MSSLNSQSQSNRGIHWPAIVATLLVQLLVVLALSVAAAFYLEWSSDANQAEFMRATKPSASVANHSGESSAPIQASGGEPIRR